MGERTYAGRLGANFRTLMNDLKRTPAAAASDLGVDAALVRSVIAGEVELPFELVERAVRAWPVSERDFYGIRDDCPHGVLLMPARDAAASRRVFERGGREYYEYRDTVMSRGAMFRPEWIKMLHAVGDADPYNPTIQWNQGHFLWQFTYFIGEVNYYYEWGGCRSCAEMNTGDSVFGVPYAPHSFASRTATEPGRILALTYGGRLMGDAQHEASVLGGETAARFPLSFDSRRDGAASILRMHLENGSYTASLVAATAGIASARLAELLEGRNEPTQRERRALAQALVIDERELLPRVADVHDGVRIVRRRTARQWPYPHPARPTYRITELAASRTMPTTRGIELEVLAPGPDDPAVLEHRLHEYGYNLGDAAVRLHWRTADAEHSEILAPDDSFYLRPFVAHWFTPVDSSDGRVLCLRIGGRLSGDTLLEASVLGPAGMRRMAHDAECWFNAGDGD